VWLLHVSVNKKPVKHIPCHIALSHLLQHKLLNATQQIAGWNATVEAYQ